MKVFILLGLIIASSLVIYWTLTAYRGVITSRKLIERTQPFQLASAETSNALLVLGDSTAVGVGAARPEDSVPGRVAATVGATFVENHAMVGAQVHDLRSQLAQVQLPQYQLILIQIGANDMVRFHRAEEVAQELAATMQELPPAEQVIVISAGDLGTARLLPPPLRPFYTRTNRAYHREFARALTGSRATYVDLSQGPGLEQFAHNPSRVFAEDQFHLSSEGYGLWFEAVRTVLPST